MQTLRLSVCPLAEQALDFFLIRSIIISALRRRRLVSKATDQVPDFESEALLEEVSVLRTGQGGYHEGFGLGKGPHLSVIIFGGTVAVSQTAVEQLLDLQLPLANLLLNQMRLDQRARLFQIFFGRLSHMTSLA